VCFSSASAPSLPPLLRFPYQARRCGSRRSLRNPARLPLTRDRTRCSDLRVAWIRRFFHYSSIFLFVPVKSPSLVRPTGFFFFLDPFLSVLYCILYASKSIAPPYCTTFEILNSLQGWATETQFDFIVSLKDS
jgi:hypothetical protein